MISFNNLVITPRIPSMDYACNLFLSSFGKEIIIKQPKVYIKRKLFKQKCTHDLLVLFIKYKSYILNKFFKNILLELDIDIETKYDQY
jgi:hypothetical protein